MTMIQGDDEVSDYQRYLSGKSGRPRAEITFVLTVNGWFLTFDRDAQRVAAMLDRRMVMVDRQQTIEISPADLRRLIRARVAPDYVEGIRR